MHRPLPTMVVAVGPQGDGPVPRLSLHVCVLEHSSVAYGAPMTDLLAEEEVPPAALLLRDLEGLTDELVLRIREGEFAYAEARGLSLEELTLICRDNLAQVLSRLAGAPTTGTGPAKRTGRLKAEAGVPLAALLHAYRLAGRLIWDRLVEAAGDDVRHVLPRLGGEVWVVIDEVSGAAAEAHQAFMMERSAREAGERAAHLRALLGGRVDRAQLWDTRHVLDLPEEGTFLAIYAEGVSTDDVLLRIESQIRRFDARMLWIRDRGCCLGMLDVTSARIPLVVGTLKSVKHAQIAISRPFESLLNASDALAEAQLAFRCKAPGTPGLSIYGDDLISLMAVSSPEPATLLANEVFGRLLRLPDVECTVLLETLETWFECGGSNSEVATRLHYHRNTIHQRLRRVEELTGRSCSNPVQASELYLALRALRLRSGSSMDRVEGDGR